MKKVVESIKGQFKVFREHPKVAIPVGVGVVLVVGVLVALVATGNTPGVGKKDPVVEAGDKKIDPDKLLEELRKRKVTPAPVITGTGTLDVSRAVGRFALAQGRGRIKKPTRLRVRVSAAPKQTVTVDYQLSCYKATGKTSVTRSSKKRYRTKPPDTRQIALPMSGADECTATVGAQLTRGTGRVKVALLSG